MNKIMKFQIIKPMDCDWSQFGRVLNLLQSKTQYILNKTIQIAWEYDNFSSEYKKEYNKFPDSQVILGYKSGQAVQNYAKKQIKEEISMFNSSNVDATLARATSRWKTDKKEVFLGEKSIASFRKDVPIDIRDTSINILQEDSNYYAKLSLISNTYKKELDRKSGQFLVLLKVGDNTQKTILDRILTGKYEVSGSQIVRHKNKWFINLCYAFEPKVSELDSNNIMGIDMGIANAVYIAFNNSYKRASIKGGEIEQFRKQVERRKVELGQQTKYCGNGRIGHGRKTRTKPVEVTADKIANFKNTINHKYSRYIVDLAVKNNCGVIQLEDLSGIANDDNFLKNWSYYNLREKITYKAEEKGIKVIPIDPKYTSQRCSKCGHIHKDNRPDQKTFECLNCGFKTNADYNAARNIATKDIDLIIKETLKTKK